MCTATYLPLTKNGFILTHSRDEQEQRPSARPPQSVHIGDHIVTFPQDPQSQGTWIAASATASACLLNGAFHPHRPAYPYKHSRGLIIPHFYTYRSVADFEADYDFTNIEPFTLLIAEVGRLMELRWNGHRLFLYDKDPQRPHIWSSVTLYSTAVIEKRESWFHDWQRANPTPTVESIRWFHQHAGDGDRANSLRMNRQNGLLTLSLTSIISHNEQVDHNVSSMIYEDFTQDLIVYQTIRPAYAIG